MVDSQKTVFISYRRSTSKHLARAIFENLRSHGFDVFLDVEKINAGEFGRIILRQIAARAHFIVLLSPGALKRCAHKGDWLRREIEEAMRLKRNIVPIVEEGFDFAREIQFLPAEWRETFSNINMLPYYHDYYDAAMDKLRNRFLKQPEYIAIQPTPEDDEPEIHRRIQNTVRVFENDSSEEVGEDTEGLIGRFLVAHKQQQWQHARDLLGHLSEHEDLPSVFNGAMYLAEIERALQKDQEERQRRMKREYSILRMMARHDTPDHVRSALNAFWESYPGYDPDDLAGRFSFEAALQHAASFTGNRNQRWMPFITTFDDLKIPDMAFCLVPTGKFQMGNRSGFDNEKPVHLQTISQPYWIARYPVTNAQWARAVRAGVVEPPIGELPLKWYNDAKMTDAPVVGVPWFFAREFATWLGCYLPSELEWEYAARGVESWVYPWGNEWHPDYCVWGKNSGGKPALVTAKPQGDSWVGAGHMSGNVWELTSSLAKAYPFDVNTGSMSDPGERTDLRLIIRGGAWNEASASYFRSTMRNWGNPVFPNHAHGFRCARSL